MNEEVKYFTKTLTFKGLGENLPDTQLKLIERIETNYRSYLWPCSVVLAQFVYFHNKMFTNKCVMEIGSGTSLPSILISKCCQHSLLYVTDKYQGEKYTEILKEAFKLNNVDLEASNTKIVPLNWGTIPSWLTETQVFPEIIIGADCFYEEELFEPVLKTVYFLLRTKREMDPNSDPVFYFTYQVRDSTWNILYLLEKWKLQSTMIPLKSFEGDSLDIAGSKMPGSSCIEMYEIRLKD